MVLQFVDFRESIEFGGNLGKFNLAHIWDRDLLKTHGLNLKRHEQAVGHVNSNNSNLWDRDLLKTPGLNLKRHEQAVGHVNSNNSNTPL